MVTVDLILMLCHERVVNEPNLPAPNNIFIKTLPQLSNGGLEIAYLLLLQAIIQSLSINTTKTYKYVY